MPDGSTIYESWDLAESIVLSHSDFYHLTPVGIGTPYVESLTGYIIRLAEAHSVSVEVLFSKGVMPAMDKEYWACQGERTLSSTVSHRIKAINSTGVIATDWVKALEAITRREDLRFLTLLTWTNILSQRHLIRSVRAWCPACYEGWRIKGEVIYEPLLWELETVSICPNHRCRLRLQCGYCNHSLALVERYSRPGYCSKCRNWLGISEETVLATELEIGEEEFGWQAWSVAVIGELLAVAPSLASPPPKGRLAEAIAICIEESAEGVLTNFASLIRVSKTTVWGWHSGKMRVTLDGLLRVCYYTGKSVVQLFCEKYDGTSALIRPNLSQNSLDRLTFQRKKRESIDKEKVRRILEAAVEEHPPSPLYKVIERIGHHARSIYKHFPSLSHQIATRYAEYQESTRKQKKGESREAIRQAAFTIHQNGLYPSLKRVYALLEGPVCLKYKEMYEVLMEVRRELGLVC